MSFGAESRSQLVPRSLLVLLRVYLGVMLLGSAWSKIMTGPIEWGRGMTGYVLSMSENAIGPYRSFVETVVVPNPEFFGILIAFGEFLLGVAFVAGAVTRGAALFGAFMFLNYMAVKGHWFLTPSSNDAPLFFICAVLFVGAAGRAYGVDFYLKDRFPKVPLW